MLLVFVVARDRHMRALLRAELREAGVEALGMETAGDLASALGKGAAPGAVVIDAAEAEPARRALENLARRVKLIVIHSRIAATPPIPGALALYRPITVEEITQRVLSAVSPHHP